MVEVGAQEIRIAALEKQLHDLLRWKQSISSLLGVAFTAVDNALVHSEKSLSPISIVKLHKAAEAVQTITSDKEIPLAPTWMPRRLKVPALVEKQPIVVEPEVPSAVVKKNAQAFAETSEGHAWPIDDKPNLITPACEETALVPEKASTKVAFKILNIIQRYGQNLKNPEPQVSASEDQWLGRAKFAPKVEFYVDAGLPIKMILPSFPWKSINVVDKVTEKLPDLGEELAMARLNSLCVEIAGLYQPGAEITIATDGLVFNDIVGITDEDTWEYSRALMDMVAQKGYHAIKMVRVMDLLGMTEGKKMTKELYLNTVEACREELGQQFGKPEDAVREMIRTDEDTLLTYRGFIRFLETDLRHSPVVKKAVSGGQYRKIVKQVAMGMMTRAESFTKIIQAKCPDYVRLSIHPSSGAVKLSIPLIPQVSGAFPKTPWHCSIAVGIDGSYSTVHSRAVRDTHNLIHRHGRPYFYREQSELYDWAEAAGAEFEHLYPKGVRVFPRADAKGPQELSDANLEKLGRLAAMQSPVNVQGFSNREDGYVEAIEAAKIEDSAILGRVD